MPENMPAATVTREPPRDMVVLRGDLAAPEIRAAACAATGTAFPGRRQIVLGEGQALAWMGPDELLLILPRGGAAAACKAIGHSLAGQHHLVADVSDARALFRIDGPGAREVLAKGTPADLSPARFAPGEIRRTRLGPVACAFWMTGAGTFELLCFRSVADHVAEWLAVASRPGSLPGHFT